ncbi:MAG: CotH kinase family protein, partial [Bacteroidales bacterium]|nr:CotH kinase family protein [Bacteroidales bacterium]
VFYTAETYFSLSPENPKGQKFPKIKKRDISETLVNLQKFLFETEDEVFIENVGKVFDLDNVADWHILLLLTNNQDGIMKNFYLYKQDAYTLIRFAIWDYDHSFGRDGDNELNMLERKIDCNRSILIKRLMENPEIGYKDLLKRKWDKYRKSGVISCVNLYRMIFDNHIRIQSEIKHNFNLWPINSEDYFDDANYYQEIVLMQNYLKIRIPELDNYFEKL